MLACVKRLLHPAVHALMCGSLKVVGVTTVEEADANSLVNFAVVSHPAVHV
jgi:hypothetical protein